jgi:hypothetical protein
VSKLLAALGKIEPPTSILGNRCGYNYFNDLRPNVANVLHPFRRQEFCSHAQDSAAGAIILNPLLQPDVRKNALSILAARRTC